MTDLIFSKVKEANDRYGLFGKGDKILVGLSGGADSVCLISALKEYFPYLELYGCHVNHMLRGDEADRDSDFASRLCQKMGIPFELLKTDVNAIAKKDGISTELAARNIRYAFFEDMCKKHGIKLVATAHTLSDSAETVLFNLARGTALSGLCGIPAKRQLSPEITLIRPLIFASRNQIEDYLSQRNIEYVTDSSNLTDDYTRNRIRHNIIPELKKINPAFEESIKNTCISAADAADFINSSANNSMTDKTDALKELPDCVLSETIVKLYKEYSGKTLLENVHIRKILELIRNISKTDGKCYEVCLPGTVSAFVDRNRLFFGQTERHTASDIGISFDTKLSSGFNEIYGTEFSIYVQDDLSSPNIPEGYNEIDSAMIPVSFIEAGINARSRTEGDSIVSGKMTKKLKSLFNHKKIPTGIRNKLPIICSGSEVLFVPLTAVSDSCKTDSDKVRVIIYSRTPL